MDYIVKSAPRLLAPGAVETFSAKSLRKAAPSPGDRIYVWFSETKGGQGLAGYGHLVDALGDAMLEMRIEIETVVTAGALAIADIRPWRDALGDDVRIGIASKVYKTAHQWVAVLTDAEADFLTDRVTPRSG